MVRLTKLKIDRFRNVKPGTVLEFGPTFNVLLGKNATGKTTLLDLIAAVTNDDLSGYAKEEAGFDLTWWLAEGEHHVERRVSRTPAKFGAVLEGVRSEQEYDDVSMLVAQTAQVDVLRVEIQGTRGVCRRPAEPDVLFDVTFDAAHRYAGLMTVARAIRAGNLQPHEYADVLGMLLGGWVGRFDEALGALTAITATRFELTRIGSAPSSANHPWAPSGFSKAIDALDDTQPVVVAFDQFDGLKGVPHLLGFASAEACPRLLTRSQKDQTVTTQYHGFDFLFRRADGSQISHKLLSFGQKRLFSFLWYLAVRGELPVVADELLNGLHHEWIEVCLDRLYERQSFLATQHPYLLDHIPIESAEGVGKTFIRCTLERDPDGREQMVWRNFTKEEAERFFIAHQTGIQHVSEVLRTEDLW